MSGLDELFNNPSPKPTTLEPPGFNKEKWVKDKAEARNAAFEMLDDATKSMSNPDTIGAYIDVQSRFDRYSVSNALLVAYQCPEAKKLADFDTWKKQEVNIKKGEQGIVILEPGKEYQRKDGSTGVSYNIKKVFDISQTTSQAEVKDSTISDYKSAILLLTRTSPVPISLNNDLEEGFDARYNPEYKEIHIRQGMSGEDIFRNLSREIAFAKLDKGGEYNRSQLTFKAVCISAIVCKRVGVPIRPITALESRSFIGLELKEKRAELNKVREVANGICVNYFKEQSNRANENHNKTAKER